LPGKYLAIINPAAGGGRSGKLLGPALDRLRAAGLEVEVRETSASGHAADLAREAWREGYRKFISVGGDGTSYEIVNGLFPLAEGSEPPTLGFLPLGTGNSFLRDFSDQGVEYAMQSLIAGRSRKCDVLRLRHKDGVLHYINLLSIGFSADVATLRMRRFASWGSGLSGVDFHLPGAFSPPAVSSRRRRRAGNRPSPLSVSDFQQQQIHRRDNDDCAQG
jgi:diacylglycerol kinase (ATP)